MDKVQQEVYNRIRLHCEYAVAAKVIPIQIMHGELLRFMDDYTAEQINGALRQLFNDGLIVAGPTAHGTYITLPQYAEQVNGKLNK